VLENLDWPSLWPRGTPNYCDYVVLCDTPGVVRQRGGDPVTCAQDGLLAKHGVGWSYVFNGRISASMCRLEA